ncbi:RpiB/LacA/LacB family sugar-phosphate isomerase [Neisseria sicca]|jgi:sugar-phosphate isomerase, RpiB/LacA/LacB family|uniref:RpiB/LacA/LacB family sugar-phosphate isomerase n=1 Tax=Neisseria sicca TaxID=490 RepID=A0A2I1XE94_NEISI|nr:RpiB/LacA/LacB family sugar-phosphate isomerase [Neisseria sicca]KJJ19304.1 putative ribose-5-phosphate isomerase B [Neisseria sp. HMSC06F02]MBS6044405.1 RpiB/LacA/LacB family sugar-phosphate isomerase [Neisseria sp.]OFN06156.1 ribose-5-phosphate isomerase [Neisseria sp. HMSC055F11]OFN31160.1 ribose-5-phosphate isomerase [Neisseria sp. HMSC059F02]OFS01839.1 ribose-5-phosphate isomerase [Neisseria sp. HMSC067H09]OHR42820.1 ribose-5-phosphate isomerase [Neisseria sp. HMSC071B12]OHR49420.1 r
MRLIIAAPANGTTLKNALKAHLQNDPRVDSLTDLSSPDGTYPQLSFAAAQEVASGRADRAILICGTGVGTAIAANKVHGIRAATAHDLITLRGSVENYDAQVLCMGQNVIAAPAAWALVDIWLNLRHNTDSGYAPKVGEIEAYECGK